MKPHGKGRWESLYFHYPEVEAPARDALTLRAPVTIAGAGPICLVGALTQAG